MKAILVREPSQVPAEDLRSKLQPGATGPGDMGKLARVGIYSPQPCTPPPILTLQCSCCSLPQDFSHNPPPGLPFPAQPQPTYSPGVTP